MTDDQGMSYSGAIARTFERTRQALPRSRELPPEEFRVRHHAVLIILGAHAIGIAAFGTFRGYPVAHSVAEGAIIAVFVLLASAPFSTRTRSAIAATGLVTSSAILVHLSGGAIEMHFHFFVVLGLMTLYHDWTPYLVAFAYVVVHHGVLGVLLPSSVYDHEAAQSNPWAWAAIHGVFVLAAAIVQIFSWRTAEREHERAEGFRLKFQAAHLRRRSALQINDSVLQGLVVAKLALAVGDRARSEKALDAALDNARTIISDLLDSGEGTVTPGSLILEQAPSIESATG